MKIKDKDEIVNYINELFLQVKAWRAPYEARWRRFYRLYRNYKSASVNYYRSNIFVPYIFAIVENIVPKMLGTIFNTQPVISVQPRNSKYEGTARLLERILDYQLDDERVEFFYKILEFFKEMCIYGTAFLKVIPKFVPSEFEDFQILDYIDVEPIDLFNVFPDYRAKSVHRMKYLMQLSYEELDDLLEMKDYYSNLRELKDIVEASMDVDEAKRQRLSDIGISEQYGFDPERKIVEVIEYWDKEHIILIGGAVKGRKVLLKHEPNPFKGFLPFVMGKYIPVQHELYGIGIPEVCESLQLELNAIRNQRMDNVNFILNRMFLANKYADIDFDNLISFPGNVILSSDVNAIKPIPTPDVTKSAYLEENIVKADMDLVSGEYSYSRGEPPPRRETATTIVRLQQASNIRFDSIVKSIEFTVLRQIAKMFIRLDYQFLSQEEFAKIVGEEEFERNNGALFYEQDIEEILRQYHFQPMGSSVTAIKEIRIPQTMQLFQLFNGDPFINQFRLREMVLDAFEIKNKSELLIEPERLAQMLQEKAMSGAMSGAIPGTIPGAMSEEAGQVPAGKVGTKQRPVLPHIKPGQNVPPPEEQLAKMLKVFGGGAVKEGITPGIRPATSPVETGEVLETEEEGLNE